MSDIFISYANQDREIVKLLAETLAETQGWSVWWDREIPFGKPFDEVIEEALENARCILVAWSTHSVTSGWVIEEAQYGRDREILVPVLIEEVAIPFGFRRIQSAYLVDWNGKVSSAVFQKLISDISAIMGTAPKIHDDAQTKPIYRSTARVEKVFRVVVSISILTLFFGLAGRLLGFIKFWRLATAEQLLLRQARHRSAPFRAV